MTSGPPGRSRDVLASGEVRLVRAGGRRDSELSPRVRSQWNRRPGSAPKITETPRLPKRERRSPRFVPALPGAVLSPRATCSPAARCESCAPADAAIPNSAPASARNGTGARGARQDDRKFRGFQNVNAAHHASSPLYLVRFFLQRPGASSSAATHAVFAGAATHPSSDIRSPRPFARRARQRRGASRARRRTLRFRTQPPRRLAMEPAPAERAGDDRNSAASKT